MNRRIFYSIIILIGLGACSKPDTAVQNDKIRVTVSIPPLADIVSQIGGDHVDVKTMIQPGQNPHTFEPAPQQVQLLGMSSFYFTIGLPLEERLLEKIDGNLKKMTVVDTTQGITKLDNTDDHHDEDDDDHHHDEQYDLHVWLSPPNIKIIAQNIANELMQAEPDNIDDYRSNLDIFIQKVNQVHQRIKTVLEPYSGRTFYVFHPAFAYFGSAYNLKQEAIEIGGKTPTPKQIESVIKHAKSENVQIIFVQPQFDSTSAQTIANAIGGAIVPIDPLSDNLLGNLENIAQNMEKALRPRTETKP